MTDTSKADPLVAIANLRRVLFKHSGEGRHCTCGQREAEQALDALQAVIEAREPEQERWKCSGCSEVVITKGGPPSWTTLYNHAHTWERAAIEAREPEPHAYEPERRCCTICDARKVCHVCGEQTLLACSDCQIDFRTTIYVCRKPECRTAHERKCSAHLRASREAREPAKPFKVCPKCWRVALHIGDGCCRHCSFSAFEWWTADDLIAECNRRQVQIEAREPQEPAINTLLTKIIGDTTLRPPHIREDGRWFRLVDDDLFQRLVRALTARDQAPPKDGHP